MADMEVLAPGGHQHLVDKIKEQLAMKADASLASAVEKVIENQPTAVLGGEVLSASDAYAEPPVDLTVDGKSTQDGTPTPDAPVPIDSIEVLELPVTFIGKNIIPDFIGNGGFIAGMYYTVSGKTVTLTNDSIFSYAMFIMPWPAGEPITFSQTGNRVFQVAWFSEYPVLGSVGKYKFVINSTVPKTASAESTDGWLAVQSRVVNDFATYHVQGEWGTTATAYEPYNATTVLIPMQGHVLRSLPDGTCDTMSLSYLRPSTREGWAWYGVEVTQRVHIMTLDGSGGWRVDRFGCYYQMNELIPSTASDYSQTIVCDQLKAYPLYVSLAGITGISGYRRYGASGANWLYVRVDSVGDNLTEMKAWLAEHRPTLLYKTNESPITTQLDPIELPVLPAPDVTVCSDPSTGLQMRYVRDMQIVIDSLNSEIERAYAAIAPVESTTAKSNHAVGDYLMLGGTLCKATSAIASGETIAIGTNVAATTVDAELSAIG